MKALPDDLTAAQQAVCHDLLGWGQARPASDSSLPARLQQRLDDQLRDAVAGHDERLFVSKSRLRALDCDGRWLDQLATPFVPSTQLVTGSLVHAAIEVDSARGRGDPPGEVVDWVVDREVARDSQDAALLRGLDALELAQVQATCRDRVVEWRELWPVLEDVHLRFEQRLRWHHDRGRVTVNGIPDLVVTSPTPRADRATAVIVDLKTGRRNEVVHRGELRLYGMLWTLKHRQAPWRWATYYLAEGRWDVEDCTPALLESTVERVVHGVKSMVRLAQPHDEDELRLHPGSHCSFCGRRPNCPAAAEMDADSSR